MGIQKKTFYRERRQEDRLISQGEATHHETIAHHLSTCCLLDHQSKPMGSVWAPQPKFHSEDLD